MFGFMIKDEDEEYGCYGDNADEDSEDEEWE